MCEETSAASAAGQQTRLVGKYQPVVDPLGDGNWHDDRHAVGVEEPEQLMGFAGRAAELSQWDAGVACVARR
jgi:hypothetical protein